MRRFVPASAVQVVYADGRKRWATGSSGYVDATHEGRLGDAFPTALPFVYWRREDAEAAAKIVRHETKRIAAAAVHVVDIDGAPALRFSIAEAFREVATHEAKLFDYRFDRRDLALSRIASIVEGKANIDRVSIALDGRFVPDETKSASEREVSALGKVLGLSSVSVDWLYDRPSEVRAAVDDYCRGDCSRGGDGPSCGKLGCRG